ncbi:MAG TPA: matrixin family metalloprotease [Candidatus Paceibacterota bacterium]
MKATRAILIAVIIVGSFSYSAYAFLWNRCDNPLEYSIGTFATKFNLSRANFISALKEAEAVWETPVGKDLFAYKETKGMPVNLIYDERQALADKNKSLEASIDRVQESAATVKRSLDAANAAYSKEKAAYQAEVSQYEARLAAHTKNVNYWNSRGGAPSGEYAKLNQEGTTLRSMYAALDAHRLKVNALAAQSGKLVDQYNSYVKDINANVEVINQTADREFEQGEYVSDSKGERINIYEFTTREALVRVLAHELGHALGIDHNNGTTSIMYYLNNGKGKTASAEDVAALKKICRIK